MFIIKLVGVQELPLYSIFAEFECDTLDDPKVWKFKEYKDAVAEAIEILELAEEYEVEGDGVEIHELEMTSIFKGNINHNNKMHYVEKYGIKLHPKTP